MRVWSLLLGWVAVAALGCAKDPGPDDPADGDADADSDADTDADVDADGGAPCELDEDCPPGTAFCLADDRCHGCRTDDDCAEDAPVCGPQWCVECAGDEDCPPERPACLHDGLCRECHASEDCPPERPVCWVDQGICESCQSDEDCPGDRRYCGITHFDCGECRDQRDCPDERPYCYGGFCSGCCECNCLSDPFAPGEIDCAVACANVPAVCDAGMAQCFRCEGIPRDQCEASCDQFRSSSPEGAAIWGCMARSATCDEFLACYFDACTVDADPGGGCVIDDCSAGAGPPRSEDGPGVLGDPCRADEACHQELACFDGECLCLPGWVATPWDRCVDVVIDPAHCGAVGNVCRDGQICCDGACSSPP